MGPTATAGSMGVSPIERDKRGPTASSMGVSLIERGRGVHCEQKGASEERNIVAVIGRQPSLSNSIQVEGPCI